MESGRLVVLLVMPKRDCEVGSEDRTRASEWKRKVAKYQVAATGRALFQVLNTIIPYALLWFGMKLAISVSLWLAVPLAILAGGFLVRIFIIFHDCGHGSFFRSPRANHLLGTVAGTLCFTPYWHWRWEHAIHHASAGNLDRRGTGDVWTMTVQEYLQASRWKRSAYRFVRNPGVLFILAPLVLFLVRERFTSAGAGGRERLSVHTTNLALVMVVAGMASFLGWKHYVFLQLIVMTVAGSAGVWLFYVQHQFEGVYWERGENWDYAEAAFKGSSFYRLPKLLQWFSGNIGFHHIHHLSPQIPNYNLEACHRAETVFQTVKPITLRESLRALRFRLWDEQRRVLIGYREFRAMRLQATRASEA